MKSLDSLLLDLGSPNSATRDQAALDLMELKNVAAVVPLLSAIAKPENVNHRGTLVYALGAFNCQDHLEVLVDLALTGNYEVSTSAIQTIEDSELSTVSVQRLETQLSKYEPAQLPFEHGRDAYNALLNVIPNRK